MRNKHQQLFFILLASLFMLFYACNNSDSQPKPHGYFRIDLPERQYRDFHNENLSFRYPEYATIVIDPMNSGNKNWFDIVFPAYNAKIHCSYHPVAHNFDTLVEDARAFAIKHIPKASGIRQTLIEKDSVHVYGLIYDISGIGAASPCQFFLSDTTTNFIRGALYFSAIPNNDSLAPVIKFIRADIDTLIYSFRWASRQ